MLDSSSKKAKLWLCVFVVAVVLVFSTITVPYTSAEGTPTPTPKNGGIILYNVLGKIYIITPDGHAQEFMSGEDEGDLTWSPDGRYLASASGEYIAIRDIFSGQQRLIKDNGVDLAWSPDGKSIALSTGEAICILNVIDGKRRLCMAYNAPFRSFHPTWSPDSDTLAFEIGSDMAGQIDLIDANGKNQRRLISAGQAPVWSPDGKHIAYTLGGSWNSTLYIADADGKNQRVLAHYGDHPSWSPDSNQIVYAYNRVAVVAEWGVRRVDIHTGQIEVINTTRFASAPSWSPKNVTLSQFYTSPITF